jgi:hypothetical protein
MGGPRVAQVYSPDLLPLLQTLLATLADIDFAFERDLANIERSTAEESLRRQVTERLRQKYRERRTPCVQQIAALQEQIRAVAAGPELATIAGPDAPSRSPRAPLSLALFRSRQDGNLCRRERFS